MESFIFLGIILLVGAITNNKSIVFATIFVLILKCLFNITEYFKIKGVNIEGIMTQFRKEGINWGVLIITIAILIPIATGEIGFSHLLSAFKSPVGWVAIISGLLSGQPEITVALVIGTIMGVVFFKGIAAGPVIASGITFCILKVLELFLKH